MRSQKSRTWNNAAVLSLIGDFWYYRAGQIIPLEQPPPPLLYALLPLKEKTKSFPSFRSTAGGGSVSVEAAPFLHAPSSANTSRTHAMWTESRGPRRRRA